MGTGHAHFPHRTETTDDSILISGEIDVGLDGGEVVHMKASDVMVMRAGTHCRRNAVPAITALILIDAEPTLVNGARLQTLFAA